MVDRQTPAPRVSIGALRVRLPGGSRADGQTFATALTSEIAQLRGLESGQFAGASLRVQAQPGATPAAIARQVAARIGSMVGAAQPKTSNKTNNSGGNHGV